MRKYNCKICGKPFISFPSHLRAGACSKECGYKLRKVLPNSGQYKKGNTPPYAGKKLPEWLKRKLSEGHQKSIMGKGKKHWKWKGGGSSFLLNISRKVMEARGVKKECSFCGSVKRVHVHHKNKNRKDNSQGNLMYLCLSCHTKLHHFLKKYHERVGDL